MEYCKIITTRLCSPEVLPHCLYGLAVPQHTAMYCRVCVALYCTICTVYCTALRCPVLHRSAVKRSVQSGTVRCHRVRCNTESLLQCSAVLIYASSNRTLVDRRFGRASTCGQSLRLKNPRQATSHQLPSLLLQRPHRRFDELPLWSIFTLILN